MSDHTAPENLSRRSQELWKEIVGRRAKSPERLTLLRVALESLDRADEAAALVAVEGLVFETLTTKTKHLHPAVRAEKDARAQFLRAWAQLGLDWDHKMDRR